MFHKAATLTVAGKCGKPKTEGVQVVEGVGLVASGFKFLLGLGSVFAEECDGLLVTSISRIL